jgi:hypothetical protein
MSYKVAIAVADQPINNGRIIHAEALREQAKNNPDLFEYDESTKTLYSIVRENNKLSKQLKTNLRK